MAYGPLEVFLVITVSPRLIRQVIEPPSISKVHGSDTSVSWEVFEPPLE